MLILGLNCFHGDSSACLISNGVLLSAVEEERFRRIKHWSGFPTESIRYCLSSNSVNLRDIDHIAINQSFFANYNKKLSYLFRNQFSLSSLNDKLYVKFKRRSIDSFLSQAFPNDPFSGKINYVEHHFAHLASAFYPSPFTEAVTVCVDGFGDFVSTSWGLGSNVSVEMDGKIYFPHSLGIFYQAMTQYLGFLNYGDEYKVMGLAPYGKPNFLKEINQVIHQFEDGSFKLNLNFFQHHIINSIYTSKDGCPIIEKLYSTNLENLLGPARLANEPLTQRHMDIAYCIQFIYEETFFNLLNSLHSRYGVNSLALAGGCAMNSVANGKICLRTPFKKLYVQAAAGDAGGAIGSAIKVWNKYGDKSRNSNSFFHDHAYWGPSFSNEYIEQVLKLYNSEFENESFEIKKYDSSNSLFEDTALDISNGLVVGWFQGRMEWGPRALGNRSILCDPRRANIKDILNIKIKRRESFRPFAPSILNSFVSDWFEQNDEVPFMSQVYQIRFEKRKLIPAVTHVDGSGRLQTVYKHTNPRFFGLISFFNEITGVPIILNTSFNENEPIVCNPNDALNCFFRTKMDLLVMENWVIRRNISISKEDYKN